MHVPVSLSFSLYLYLQKWFGSRSDPNGIQERMFRQFKIESTQCHTKADAHDKMGFQYISMRVYIVRSHARIQRGDRGPDPPEKLQKYRISSQYWTGSPEIYYQASIQRWAIIGTPSKTAFKGVSLAGR